MVDPAEVRNLIRLATTRTGNAVFDEDLFQEASLRALDAFRRAGHVQHPKAFLRKIVGDAVRDHWRRRRPPEDISTIDERRLAFDPHFEADIDRRRQTAILHAALRCLDPAKRDLIRMFYEEGLSIPEIARIHCTSVPAVKMQLLRARQTLARIVGIRNAKKPR